MKNSTLSIAALQDPKPEGNPSEGLRILARLIAREIHIRRQQKNIEAKKETNADSHDSELF